MKKFQTEIDKLKAIHKRVKDLIEQYPPERREMIIFDKWSLKDVVAHLNTWMEDDLKALENLVSGKEPYWEPDVDAFNKHGVDARKRMKWEDVYEEFVILIEKLNITYNNLPDHLFETKMWGKHDGTPLRSIHVDIKHWEGEHIPSLESNLK
ncbi:MAG: hypothetical protein AAB778_01425 [Patescibacteria group bacterium]